MNLRRYSSLIQGCKYQIQAACLLQRPPITIKTLSQMEAEYEKYRLLLESETSRGIFKIEGRSSTGDDAVVSESMNNNLKAGNEGEGEIGNLDPAYMNLGMDDLRRELDRKLYLMVKNVAGKWRLPSKLVPDEIKPLSEVYIKGIVDRLII